VAALAIAAPATAALTGTATASTGASVVNASFEQGWSGTAPATCWQQGGVGSGSATLTASSTAHSGARSARLSVTSLASRANRKVVVDQHTAGCAPTVVAGHRYTVSVWYRSSARPQMVLYYRDAAGTWQWWDQGSQYAARSSWGSIAFTTAPVPAGATALSFGPSLTSTGWLLVDDAAIVDRGATSTASPTASATTSPAPTATASATPVAVAPTSTATASSAPTPTSTPTSSGTPTASSTPTATATSTASSTPTSTSTSSGTTVHVSTAAQLTSALQAATPGTTIVLADGTYAGRFTLARSGTATAPIRITGSRAAVLDGGSISTGYVLHLDRANYVQVDGFTVRDGQKAVVLDESSHVVLDHLDLGQTGDEVLLLRNYSSDNVVSNNEIHDSGLVTPGYGEGVYVGLSKSNWSSTSQSRTGGAPDTSDRNRIQGNHIVRTTAESVDIKEGTTGGVITGNTFDATGLSGANYADSWVDIAGNGYLVQGNTGLPGGALLDGYQTHVILAGWGNDNVFDANTSTVNAAGYGVNIHTKGTGNVVKASNTVVGAAKGLTNIAVTR
ncbi:MAG TPA: right-handed parallel beta-helix repeat-containing protein, partial [Motilibacteraceae bacterium]|nr:right-handed parallel beta-helix repeat-containing protein [Motilibacteraceae bacterium]